ncbi:hypothetical protein EG240_14190 [Paenimyroides tangerinum]|uniref:Uncharacterized protein n=1 Tax=Paenimyroides tangerinum TaxID=2488728 RepID=A0A3P3W5Y3_9FLAO|nr:hypothetical protein [Paenimyroides tangerinum]RRJ88083.1 hypothetical protein EG240_14190 [Paenimyroides tangerinum]
MKKDILLINDNEIAKIERKKNEYYVTSVKDNKSYIFIETESKLANKDLILSYTIKDLSNNKETILNTEYRKRFISPRESFYVNFSTNPIKLFSGIGFDTAKLDSIVLSNNYISIEQFIQNKNDSISNHLEKARLKAENNNVKIEYDGKIFHHINGEKIQIGRAIKEKTAIQNSYNLAFHLLKDERFELVGYYSTQGVLNSNLLGQTQKFSIYSELIIKDDKIYKIPYISDSSSLPLSKDQTAYTLFTIIYNKFY